MKTNAKLTTIVSLILTAVLAVAGTVLFFLIGFHTASGKEESITLTYGSYVMLNDKVEEEIDSYLKGEFPSADISKATSTTTGEITISGEGVSQKADALESYLRSTYPDGEFYVAAHASDTKDGYTFVWRALIVGGCIVVLGAVYVAVRYRIYTLLPNLVGSVATAALVLALALITRIPVGEYLSVVVIAALCLYQTLALLLFSRAGKAFPQMKELSAEEAVAAVWKEAKKPCLLTLAFALIACVGFVWSGVWPVLLTVLAVAVCAFTGICLTPALLALCKAPVDRKDKEKEHYTYQG